MPSCDGMPARSVPDAMPLALWEGAEGVAVAACSKAGAAAVPQHASASRHVLDRRESGAISGPSLRRRHYLVERREDFATPAMRIEPSAYRRGDSPRTV